MSDSDHPMHDPFGIHGVGRSLFLGSVFRGRSGASIVANATARRVAGGRRKRSR